MCHLYNFNILYKFLEMKFLTKEHVNLLGFDLYFRVAI